jgi:hypothetical protein
MGFENTIPVWCFIDVAALLNTYPQGGTKDNPQYLGEYSESDPFVSMLAPLSNVVKGNGTSELEVKASRINRIRVMICAFTQPTDKFVEWVEISPNHLERETDVCAPFLTDNIYPSGNSGFISAMSASINDNVNVGDHTGYIFKFKITNQSSGQELYYSWDPSVTVIEVPA